MLPKLYKSTAAQVIFLQQKKKKNDDRREKSKECERDTMKSLNVTFLLIIGVLAIASIASADNLLGCGCRRADGGHWWTRKRSCSIRCSAETAEEQSDKQSAYKQWLDYILSDKMKEADEMLKPWSEARYFGDSDAIKCGPDSDNTIYKKDIAELQFENCSMKRILFDVFETYPKLRSLNISHMNLERIEPSTFERAPELHTLIASHNRIKAIPYYLFWGAEQLQYVDFSHNQINNISVQALAGAKAVIELNLAKNELKQLHPDLFATFSSLNKLDLSQNKLIKLDREAFGGAFKLKTLDLSYNSISSIDSESFANLTELETLNLRSNDLQLLPVDVFAHLKALKHLDLSFTHLVNIELGTFTYNRQLQKLDVSFNWMERFDFSLFLPEHTELKELYLDANQLRDLRGFSKNVLPNLNTLGLMNNLFECAYVEFFFEEIYWKGLKLRIDLDEMDRNRTNINGIACMPAKEEVRETVGFGDFNGGDVDGGDDEAGDVEAGDVEGADVEATDVNRSSHVQNQSPLFTHSTYGTHEDDVDSLYYRNAQGEELLIKSIHHREMNMDDFVSGVKQTTTAIVYYVFNTAQLKSHGNIWSVILLVALIVFIGYSCCGCGCRRRCVSNIDISSVPGKCEMKMPLEEKTSSKPHTIVKKPVDDKETNIPYTIQL